MDIYYFPLKTTHECPSCPVSVGWVPAAPAPTRHFDRHKVRGNVTQLTSYSTTAAAPTIVDISL